MLNRTAPVRKAIIHSLVLGAHCASLSRSGGLLVVAYSVAGVPVVQSVLPASAGLGVWWGVLAAIRRSGAAMA